MFDEKYGLFDFKGAPTKNCESVKKGKFVTKIFLHIMLNEVLIVTKNFLHIMLNEVLKSCEKLYISAHEKAHVKQ